MKTVRKRYHLSRDAEITLEANPDSAGDWKALRALRRTRIYKSFRLAFHGWMDFHTGVAELSTGKTAANGSGRSTAQLLKTTLFKNMKEGS